MRNYILASLTLFLFSVGYCAKKKHQKPSRAKQQLAEWVIPLYKVQRGDKSIWCALPEYVFPKKDGEVMRFLSKFPDSLERYRNCTIKFFAISCRDKAAAKEIAQQGYLLFNPQNYKK